MNVYYFIHKLQTYLEDVLDLSPIKNGCLKTCSIVALWETFGSINDLIRCWNIKDQIKWSYKKVYYK